MAMVAALESELCDAADGDTLALAPELGDARDVREAQEAGAEKPARRRRRRRRRRGARKRGGGQQQQQPAVLSILDIYALW